MPSHLSDIGFDFTEENFYDDFVDMLDANMQKTSMEISANGKAYVVVFVDGDIEFWLPIGSGRSIDPMSAELHYNTHRWMEAVNPSWVTLENDETQGLMSIWDKDESYIMNIKIPNGGMVPELLEDKLYSCQLACFVESYKHFKTEDEFQAKYEGMSSKAFVPTGQFTCDEDDAGQSARAWIIGHIKNITLKTNSFTNKQYYQIVLESYCMDFDVLLDAESVTTELCVGDILSVNAWLTGKVRNRYYGDPRRYSEKDTREFCTEYIK